MRSDQFIKELKTRHQQMAKCPNCKSSVSILYTESGCFDRIKCQKCGTYMMYDPKNYRDVFYQIDCWNKECQRLWEEEHPPIEPLQIVSGRSFSYKP